VDTGVRERFERLGESIGAGAIELAGARAPQISDSRGTGGHNTWSRKTLLFRTMSSFTSKLVDIRDRSMVTMDHYSCKYTYPTDTDDPEWSWKSGLYWPTCPYRLPHRSQMFENRMIGKFNNFQIHLWHFSRTLWFSRAFKVLKIE